MSGKDTAQELPREDNPGFHLLEPKMAMNSVLFHQPRFPFSIIPLQASEPEISKLRAIHVKT